MSIARQLANELPIHLNDVNGFKTEYNKCLFDYLTENQNLLKKAKNITLTKGFNTDDIDELIEDIENFKNSLTPTAVAYNVIGGSGKPAPIEDKAGKFNAF
jgi:hypothetical protein